jgi:hypothetical protein
MWKQTRLALGAVALLPTVLVSAVCANRPEPPLRQAGSTAPDTRPQDPVDAARFIFVGDTGTGAERARRVAAQMRQTAERVSASHVFLLGDNVYEYGEARFITSKFLDVYRGVLSLGVRIHAALGNHDVERCRESGVRPVPRDETAYALSRDCEVDAHLATPEFGYRDGFRYYSVQIPGSGRDRSATSPLVEVFVLDSNTLATEQSKIQNGTDEPQLRWLAEALRVSLARWKVVAMHHTLYTPTRCQWFGLVCRGDDADLRSELEPIFMEHSADVVFQGHQHFYARLKPQRGIRYFVSGAGGKKPDSARKDERALRRHDRGAFNHFVYVSATEDRFSYCAIDAEGGLRDSGSFARSDAVDGIYEGEPCSPP